MNAIPGRDIRSILFDLDGVLTRTAAVHSAAWKRLFDDFLKSRAGAGSPFRPFTESDYRRYVDGRPRCEGVKTFLESRGYHLPRGSPTDGPEKETIPGLGNRKNRYFQEELARSGVEVFQPAVEFLRETRARGLKTGVVSASENCKAVLDAAGLTPLFDTRVDGVEAARLGLSGKPAPDTFLEAARRLEAEPSRTAVVEDAIAGVEAARRGGFGLVVGVGGPEREDELKKGGADVVVPDLGKLKLTSDL